MSEIAGWVTPTRWPDLAAGGVHVWLANLVAWRGAMADCRAVLRGDECERAARYREGEPRDRYQITRGVLRFLLSRYLAVPAQDVQLTYGAHGKPGLLDESAGLHFNVSHSGELAVFAFTRQAPIGVDIERVRGEMARQDEIAERHFAPGECEALRRVPAADRCAAFFRCWARKEAVLKARGDGIFGGLESFEVNVDAGPALLVHAAPEDRFLLADLPAIPGFSGAVAVSGGDRALSGLLLECWHAAPALLCA